MRDLEHKEAVALMKWARLSASAHPALRQLFHIPNGGKRKLSVARKLKAEGTRKGASDYFLPVPRVPNRDHCREGTLDWLCKTAVLFHGLFIELKVKGNYPTPDQHEFMNDMRDNNFAAYWCMGWEAAAEILLQYLMCNPISSGRDPKPRGTYTLK